MPKSFYLLSTKSLVVDQLDGFAASFLIQDNLTFRYSLLLCTHDGSDDRNVLLVSLLRDLKLTQVVPDYSHEELIGFLKTGLGRTQEQANKEAWAFFEFGEESRLSSFTNSEIVVGTSDSSNRQTATDKKDASDGAILRIATLPGPGTFVLPEELTVENGDCRSKLRESEAFGQIYKGANGEFAFQEQDESIATLLKLPFELHGIFEAFKTGLNKSMDFSLNHEGPGTAVKVGNNEARPVDGHLELDDRKSLTYTQSKISFFDSGSSGFLSDWSPGKKLKGVNVSLIVSSLEMKTETRPNGSTPKFELSLESGDPVTLEDVQLNVTKTTLVFECKHINVVWNKDQPSLTVGNCQLLVDNGGLSMKSGSDNPATFTVPWDFTRAAQVILTGRDLSLRYASGNWELSNNELSEFELKVGVSIVSKFTDDYDLNFPVEPPDTNTKRVEIPGNCPIGCNSVAKDKGAVLKFFSGTARPEWSNPNLAITAIGGAGEPEKWRTLPFMDVDLRKLMDVDLRKFKNDFVNGEFRIPDSLSILEPGSTIQNAKFRVNWQFSAGSGSTCDLVVGMTFDLRTMTLAVDTDKKPLPLYFYCKNANSRSNQKQRLDFGLFSLYLPNASRVGFPNDKECHGFVDLSEGEMVLKPEGFEDSDGTVLMATPGRNTSRDLTETNEKDSSDKYCWWLQLNQYSAPSDLSVLRVGRKGVTLNALLQPREITLDDGLDDDNEQLLITPLSADPLEKSRQGVESRIRIKESKILNGELFARMLLPGTTNLVGELTARMSQRADGKPIFSAALTVEGRESRCSLSIGFFDALLTNPRLGISWNDRKWTVSALVNATLTVQPEVALQNGMTEIRGENSLIVNDLDLIKLNYRDVRTAAKLNLQIRKFEFSIFGLVGMRLDRVSMTWEWNKPDEKVKLVQFTSERAAITFGSGGGTRGGVSLGNAVIECEDGRVRLKSVSGATVTLSVPGQFDFTGTVGWKDASEESHFSLQGSLTTFGGLSAGGFLRYGRGIKRNGDEVRQLAVFGERKNLNYPLFTGVVWQEGGFGGGYNVELGNLSRNPSDIEILAKIDSLEPTIVDNWHFVRDNGTYLSLVGKMGFTSQVAAPDTICGYVLSIVASIDTDKRILAAGKLWLFSSQQFAEANRTRPSLVAAMQLDLRRRAITMRAETRRGGAIEAFPQLKEILDRTEAVLLLRLTPNLFDIYLERLTYTQQWLESVDFFFEASWRFSVFQETVLTYVRAKVRGYLSPPAFSTSNGGFSFSVEMDSNLEFGGLIGRQGVMNWGEFAASISVSCTAYIEVECSVPSYNKKTFRPEWRTVSKRYEMPEQQVVMGFTGEYAFRGSGGTSGGARFQVQFRSHICGRDTTMSKDWLRNPQLVDDVRNHVQHFEAQIDRVAAAATQTATARAAASKVLEARASRLLAVRTPSENYAEEWLVVENPGQDPKWALLPTWSTEWLTPKYANVPDAVVEFAFCNQLKEITYNGGSIIPAWDQANWPTDFTPPENAEGLMRELYRLNSLFWESAEESTPLAEQLSFAERQSLKVNPADGYEAIIDHRPLQRLRDALTDEDRLTLPIDVYPFSYRPGSDPNFENLERQLAQDENGANRLRQGLGQYRAARSAILALLVEELAGRGVGLFSNNFADALGESGVTVTPYIQRVPFPDDPCVKVKREKEGTNEEKSVKVIRIGKRASTEITDPNVIWVLPEELKNRVIPAKGCQEFRFKDSSASDSSQAQAEVVIKLPVDFRGLFEAIGNLKTTYFELVDHIRILRKRPGEKDFTCVADRVPLPVAIETQEKRHLLKPFVYEEVVSVPNTLNKRTQHYLDGILYRIQVIPLGWSTRPESQFAPLTRDFEAVQPFVPAQRRLRGDLALIFDSRRGLIEDNLLTARLVTVSASSDETVFPFAQLDQADLEIFYEPKIIGQTGFYGRSLELEANLSSASSELSNRQDRINREASGRELSSAVDRIPLRDFSLVEGRLKFPVSKDLKSDFSALCTAARFFARPAGASPLTPVQEIPVYISRSDDEPPISVPHLELLPLTENESGDPQSVFIAPVEASSEDPRHRVQLEWEHPVDSTLGGIEVEVWDAQENRELLTRRIEVLEERIFREHQFDFSVASEWQLIRPDLSPTNQSDNGQIESSASIANLFWDANRWFSDHTCATKELKLQLEQFKNHDGNPECYLRVLKDFWTEVARFQSDPQNDDGPETRAALVNLKFGLIAQLAGMLPPLSTQTFKELEAEYVLKRTEIGNLRLQAMIGSTPQETGDRQLDLVAARQLLALMEYRRSFAQQVIENPDRAAPIRTDQDILLMQLRSSKANRKIEPARKLVTLLAPVYMAELTIADADGLEALEVPQLPLGDMERNIFEMRLGIQEIPTSDQLNALKNRYPLSMWFLERMISYDPVGNSVKNGGKWDSFRPGVETATRLLRDSDAPKPCEEFNERPPVGELRRFRWTVSAELAGATALTASMTSKSKNVIYCDVLQKLLKLTASTAPLAKGRRFQIRPHHSLGLQRGVGSEENALQKSPIPNDLVAYVPQEILDFVGTEIPDRILEIHFVSFLHLLERLGFAVDVALVDGKKGTLTQEELVDQLELATATDDFTYFVCRGRAIDDGAAVTSEVEFSFVKVISLPESLELTDSLLENRSLNRASTDIHPRILNWFCKSISLLKSASHSVEMSGLCRKTARRIASEESQITLKALEFEHHGGAWTTIPAIGQNCRVSLTLPTLDGQEIFVRMRRVSRYVLIDEWRQAVATSSQLDSARWETSDTILFRPYYSANTPLTLPTKPFGFSGPDRIDFIISQPPDATDSRDNLLTATRTGFKHLGLTFQHRPADETELKLVRDNLKPSPNVYSGELKTKVIVAASRTLTVFPNETAIALRQLSYFLEVLLKLQCHYDVSDRQALCFEPSPLDRDDPAYLRRQPSLIATRGLHASHIENETGWIRVEVPLVQHTDLLNGDEWEARPNEWKLTAAPARGLGDDPSVEDFPDLRCSYFILFKRFTQHDGSEREPLEPLFEIKLPLCAGYRQDDNGKGKAFVIARSAQVKVRIPNAPFSDDPSSLFANVQYQTNVKYQTAGKRAYSVVVEAKYEGRDIAPSDLLIQTTREGQSVDPPRADFFL